MRTNTLTFKLLSLCGSLLLAGVLAWAGWVTKHTMDGEEVRRSVEVRLGVIETKVDLMLKMIEKWDE